LDVNKRLLNDQVVKQVKEVFDSQLNQPVEVLFFGDQHDCEYCDDTHQLIEELIAISPKLALRTYDLDQQADVARQYGVDKAPSLVLVANDGDQLTDYGVRFAGIPSGHEFSSLIQGLLLVSSRDSALDEKTRQALKALKEPVTLQVYVTPT
jgi:glutaredoxin-like protein